MFRKGSIPENVIVFARKLAKRDVEFDVNDVYTEEVMARDFKDECEEVNQMIIKSLKGALPLWDEFALESSKDNIIRMRVIQLKYDDYYVLERQIFVKARSIFGIPFWYQIVKGKLCLERGIFESKNYQFRCIGRNISVPKSLLKVKDFYYKV